MTLDPHTHHPHSLSYVLQLHRDAAPQQRELRGRLEHIGSGRSWRFASVDELLACLVRDRALDTTTPGGAPDPDPAPGSAGA